MENTNKNQYKDDFFILTQYLKDKHDINVVLKKINNNFWFSSENKIIISTKPTWKSRLNYLLHETGHAINDKETGIYASSLAYDNYSQDFRSKKKLVFMLNEEIRAWNTGKKVAIDLNLKFDITTYNNQMTNCVMSYIKYGLIDIYKGDIVLDAVNIK